MSSARMLWPVVNVPPSNRKRLRSAQADDGDCSTTSGSSNRDDRIVE
jgi:hypothetical protein